MTDDRLNRMIEITQKALALKAKMEEVYARLNILLSLRSYHEKVWIEIGSQESSARIIFHSPDDQLLEQIRVHLQNRVTQMEKEYAEIELTEPIPSWRDSERLL